MSDAPADVTLGEVWRGQQALQADVAGLRADVAEIRTTLAGQGVRVGVVWSALGVGSAALVTSVVGTTVSLIVCR